jgi:hypothetical protein
MIGLGLLGLVTAIVSPWGNYPLNDDWLFARATKIFARTGLFVIDTPTAPSLIGQLIWTWPFVKLFGFSHVLLRVLTLAMAGSMLWSTDALLVLGGVSRAGRTRALAVLALNPLFVNLALSFMTECHGYAPALAGAVIWLRSRRAADGAASPAAVGLGASVFAGALIGATFWIRQYGAVAFPALAGATIAGLVARREWTRLRRSAPALAAGTLAFATAVGSYVPWATHYHLLTDVFAGRLRQVIQFDLVDWSIAGGIQLLYLTAFLLPLLATSPLAGRPPARILGRCGVALSAGLVAYSLIQLAATDDAGALGLHRVFPFNSNVIHAGGVGPITLTDVFFSDPDRYQTVSRGIWRFVTVALVGLTALWGLPLGAVGRLAAASPLRREVALFAVIFSALSLAAAVQSFGRYGFDRYGLPLVFGTTLAVAILVSPAAEAAASPRLPAWSNRLFVAAILPMAFFTVAGVHDYFRWNDARWRLVAHARMLGVPATSIDGGYEVNGWLSFDRVRTHREPIDDSRCIGPCRCHPPSLEEIWTCHDDSYRIGMTVAADYVEVARDAPRFWLGKGRPVILSRRSK